MQRKKPSTFSNSLTKEQLQQIYAARNQPRQQQQQQQQQNRRTSFNESTGVGDLGDSSSSSFGSLLNLSPIQKPPPQPRRQPEPADYKLFAGESSGTGLPPALDVAERQYDERATRIARVLFDTDYPSEALKHVAYRMMEVADNYKNGSMTAARAAIVALDMAMYDGPSSLNRVNVNSQTEFSSYFSVDSVYDILHHMERRADVRETPSPLSGRDDTASLFTNLRNSNSNESSPMESLTPLPHLKEEEEDREAAGRINLGGPLVSPKTQETQKLANEVDDDDDDAVYEDSIDYLSEEEEEEEEEALPSGDESNSSSSSSSAEPFDADSVEFTYIQELEEEAASAAASASKLPADPLISNEIKKVADEEVAKGYYFLWQDFYGENDPRNKLRETEDPLIVAMSQLILDFPFTENAQRLTESDRISKQKLLHTSMIWCMQSVHINPRKPGESALSELLSKCIKFADGVLVAGTNVDEPAKTPVEHQEHMRDVDVAVISVVDFADMDEQMVQFVMEEASQSFAELRQIKTQKEISGFTLHYYHFLVRYRSGKSGADALEFFYQQNPAVVAAERDELLFNTVAYALRLQQEKQSGSALDNAVEQELEQEEQEDADSSSSSSLDKEAREADEAFGTGEFGSGGYDDESSNSSVSSGTEDVGLEMAVLIDPIHTGGLTPKQLADQALAMQHAVGKVLRASEVIDIDERNYIFGDSQPGKLAHQLTELRKGGLLLVMTPVYVRDGDYRNARSATLDLLLTNPGTKKIIEKKELDIVAIYFVEHRTAADYAATADGYVYVDNIGSMALPSAQLTVPYLMPESPDIAYKDILRPGRGNAIALNGETNKMAALLPMLVGVHKGDLIPKNFKLEMKDRHVIIENDVESGYDVDAAFYKGVLFEENQVKVRRPFPRAPASPSVRPAAKMTVREKEATLRSLDTMKKDLVKLRAAVAHETDEQVRAAFYNKLAGFEEDIANIDFANEYTPKEFQAWLGKIGAAAKDIREQAIRSHANSGSVKPGAKMTARETELTLHTLDVIRKEIAKLRAQAARVTNAQFVAAINEKFDKFEAGLNNIDFVSGFTYEQFKEWAKKTAAFNKTIRGEIILELESNKQQQQQQPKQSTPLPANAGSQLNAYELLGIDRSALPAGAAGDKIIKKRYHAASLAHHPDKASSSTPVSVSTALFQQIGAAYNAIKTPELRLVYDATLKEDGSPARPNTIYGSDVLVEMARQRREDARKMAKMFEDLERWQQQMKIDTAKLVKDTKDMRKQAEQNLKANQAHLERALAESLGKAKVDIEQHYQRFQPQYQQQQQPQREAVAAGGTPLWDDERQQEFKVDRELIVRLGKLAADCEDMLRVAMGRLDRGENSAAKLLGVYREQLSTLKQQLDYFETSFSSPRRAGAALESLQELHALLQNLMPAGYVTSRKKVAAAAPAPAPGRKIQKAPEEIIMSYGSSTISVGSLKKPTLKPQPQPQPRLQLQPRPQQQQQTNSDLSDYMVQLKQTANTLRADSSSQQFYEAKRQAQEAQNQAALQIGGGSGSGSSPSSSSPSSSTAIDVKIMLLGNLGAGKTTFAFRFLNGSDVPEGQGKYGSDQKEPKRLMIGSQAFNVLLVDTDGEEINQIVKDSSFNGATAAIVMVDITDPDTFLNFKNVWLKEAEDKIPPSVLTVMVFLNKYDRVDEDLLQEIQESIKAEGERIKLVKVGSAFDAKDVQDAVASVCKVNAFKRSLLQGGVQTPSPAAKRPLPPRTARVQVPPVYSAGTGQQFDSLNFMSSQGSSSSSSSIVPSGPVRKRGKLTAVQEENLAKLAALRKQKEQQK